jgi:hypothetical protein
VQFLVEREQRTVLWVLEEYLSYLSVPVEIIIDIFGKLYIIGSMK